MSPPVLTFQLSAQHLNVHVYILLRGTAYMLLHECLTMSIAGIAQFV
jgi:hypothetical protein